MTDKDFTEDDTFNKLKRTPFLELWDMMKDLSISSWDHLQSVEAFDEFVKAYGWTYLEFQKEHEKCFKSRE